jgi:hypothetical protein
LWFEEPRFGFAFPRGVGRAMVRNKPAGDAFGSNRRSPTLIRRRRDEISATKDAASNQQEEETSSPVRSRSASPRSGSASPRSASPIR